VQENYRILRVELYEEIMKKFFSTGRDYRMFAKENLDENIQLQKMQAKHDLGMGQKPVN